MKKAKKEFVIFNNYDNYEDARKEAIESLIENCEEVSNESELNESDIADEMQQLESLWYDDECCNLNRELDDRILVVADLGLWDGRRIGYKEIGKNLADTLRMNYHDSFKLYIDNRNQLRAVDSHHDGTNHYLFRQWKPTASETSRDNLRDKLYNGTATMKDINRLTVSLGKIAGEVYGF